MSIKLPDLNWRRGFWRVWVVGSFVWFATTAAPVWEVVSGDRYPSSRNAFMPHCASAEDIYRAHEPLLRRTCLPFSIATDAASVERARERVDACMAEADAAQIVARNAAEAQYSSCIESRNSPPIIERANLQLNRAQWEWRGRSAVLVGSWLLAPLLVWVLCLMASKLFAWVAVGFRREP